MATLYRRGDRWYLNWRHEGLQHRRSLGPIEKRAAEALRAEKEAELRGLITVTRGVTIGSVLRGYLAWYETARPATYRRAKSALMPMVERFDGIAAEGCPPAEIERWAATRTATGQTEKALKLARAAFRREIQQRRLRYSPMDGVRIAKPVTSRAPAYYQPDQLEALGKAAHGPLWLFLANTGLRRGELAKAQRSDVREGLLYVQSEPTGRTKNLRWRAIPLNRHALAALKHLGEDRLVTCHPDTLGDWFARDARGAGLAGSLHWLRHTFCTALVQAGVSLHEVKRLAGHSSITVTEQYAHHAPGFGRSAVDALAGWQNKLTNKHSRTRTAKKTAENKTRPRSSAG